jgi:hypothetical protein
VAVHLRQHHDHAVVVFRVRRLRLPQWLCLPLYPLLVVVGLRLGLPVLHGLTADRQAQLAARLERVDRHSVEPAQVIEAWAHAVALNPGQADYRYRLGQAYARAMHAQWTPDAAGAFRAGVQAMAAYRKAILRNPTSLFPYLAWGWTLEDVSRLAPWLDAQGSRPAGSHGIADEGLHQEARVVLGHRRLAIIDLSAAARQPMSNADGTMWLSYNGEIYNYRELRTELMACGYRFISQSDTEVIVHGYEAWGIDGLLPRLRGMFAFALYDARPSQVGVHASAPQLLLARDRLGIKPLYYSLADRNGDHAFASSVKTLLAGGTVASDLDRDALTGFLHFGSIPSPLTTVKSIRCLLPGHYLVVDLLGLDEAEAYASLQRSYATICPAMTNGPPSPRGFNDLELKRYLHDQLLRDTDTFSMAHGLELRVPYLDHTLVEYAAALPPTFMLEHGVSKPLLVHAVGDASLLEAGRRKKRGFSLPFDRWMKQHAGTLEEMALAGESLDRRAVRRLWDAFRVGRLHWSRAWALVVLGIQG